MGSHPAQAHAQLWIGDDHRCPYPRQQDTSNDEGAGGSLAVFVQANKPRRSGSKRPHRCTSC